MRLLISVFFGVPILTRPEGRALRPGPGRCGLTVACSNPHPTRRPGATSRRLVGCHTKPMFQSSPDPKAGRYQRTITFECRLLLFQSSPDPKAGRYRHPPHNAGWQHSSNPHPTRRPGATGHHGAVSAAVGSSNPHPTRRPGATFALGVLLRFLSMVPILTRPEGRALLGASATRCSRKCSNPHPTRRPGATNSLGII